MPGQAGSRPEANYFGTGCYSIVLRKSHPTDNTRPHCLARTTMILDVSCCLEYDPAHEELDAWEGMPIRR